MLQESILILNLSNIIITFNNFSFNSSCESSFFCEKEKSTFTWSLDTFFLLKRTVTIQNTCCNESSEVEELDLEWLDRLDPLSDFIKSTIYNNLFLVHAYFLVKLVGLENLYLISANIYKILFFFEEMILICSLFIKN